MSGSGPVMDKLQTEGACHSALSEDNSATVEGEFETVKRPPQRCRECWSLCALALGVTMTLMICFFLNLHSAATVDFRRTEVRDAMEQSALDLGTVNTSQKSPTNVWSNPLWNEECANAVLVKDGIDIEEAIRSHVPAIVTKWYNAQKKENRSMTLTLEQTIEASITRLIHETRHNHFIWGRERLDALLRNAEFSFNELFQIFSNVKMTFNSNAAKWQVKGEPKTGGVFYMNNLKCMSTTIQTMITRHKDAVTIPRGTRLLFPTTLSEYFGDDSMALPKINKRNGVGFDYDCGFTFVRHPIDKFLSGYGQVEYDLRGRVLDRLQFSKVDVNRFKRLAKASDDLVKRVELRFVTFVNEFLEGGMDFIPKYNKLDHVGTFSGGRMALLSAWRIDFIGRVEHAASDWHYLTHSVPQCAAGFNHTVIDSNDFKLTHHRQYGNWKPAKDIWKRVLQNNRTMFDALVDFYYQDFICYGYSMSYDDWINSRHKVEE